MRMWVGARGAMSRKAMIVSSSATRWDAISPATILQKMQSGSRRRSVIEASPQRRLRAHQEADGTDEPGHHIRDVPLPPSQRGPPRIAVGAEADHRPEAGHLDEVREPEIEGVD